MNIIKTLKYASANRFDGGVLWREQAQKHLKQMLMDQPPAEPATLRRFIASRIEEVTGIQRPLVRARLLDERSCSGFRLQRIVFDAVPGWTVGLDLFLPIGRGPFQAILCPCGHGPKWQNDHQIPPQVLARNGFAAALFDMPMFGERARDNDHFIQGPQSQMTGRSSLFYFLVDVLRTMDYLETRPDINASRGFGMTGVSGGGMATMIAPHADPRVRVIVPVCCVVSLGEHIAGGLYTGCQENYLEGQAAAGLDLHQLLSLAAPRPCLVIGGRRDDLFREPCVRRAVAAVRRAYSLKGISERFDFYMEDCGHSYTATMAARAAAWFKRWLAEDAAGAPANVKAVMLPREHLDCGTADKTGSMLDITRQRVRRLAAVRRPCTEDAELRKVLKIPRSRPAIRHAIIPAPIQWGPKGFSRHLVESAGDLPLPVLEMTTSSALPGTILAIGDAGALSVIRQEGGLGLIRRRMLGADIRGYGELAPEAPDYDVFGWCGIDRALSDLLFLSGETAFGWQARDVLRLIDFARSTSVRHEPLTLYGRGAAAWPVALAGILHPSVRRIIVDSALAGFGLLAQSERPTWNRYHYLPNVLRYFDLPALVRKRKDKDFLLVDPLDAVGQSLSPAGLRTFCRQSKAPHVAVHGRYNAGALPGIILKWLKTRETVISYQKSKIT